LKNDLDVIASEANDKHSVPWAEACSKSDVHNTPLSPFIHKDHLNGYRIQMNGSKFMNNSGFTLKHPMITVELLKQVSTNCKCKGWVLIFNDICLQVVDDFIKMNLFPKSLLD